MKKVISLILALLLCISLCACGNSLSKDCADIDEAVEVLAASYKDPPKDHKKVKENESIYRYFQKSHVEDEIWKKLKEATDKSGNSAFSMSEIHNLYNVCNQVNGFDDWFEFINVGTDDFDMPFIMYGDSGLTVDELTRSISRHFKDPSSVSVDNAWICFELPAGAESSKDFKMYDYGCRYIVLAEVSAKNGFGAFSESVCWIEGSVNWSSWTFSVKETSMSSSLLTRPTAEIEGYGAWSRLL